MTTLTVTSPLTRSEEVRRAQLALAGENVLRQNFLRDKVDGEFGEATGRACRRAKYWLGYPQGQLRATYGRTLDALLTGKRKPPAPYAARRRARQLAAKRKPLRAKAFALLVPHVGETEDPPGSNWSSFSHWYGVKGAWCAMTVTWAYVNAGSKGFQRNARWAYVPYLLGDARAGRQGLSITHEPEHGDIFVVDWQNSDGRNPYAFDHTGLFDHWHDRFAGTFRTLEGNTSPDDAGSQSNGGGLFRRTRSMKTARVVFIRVGR